MRTFYSPVPLPRPTPPARTKPLGGLALLQAFQVQKVLEGTSQALFKADHSPPSAHGTPESIQAQNLKRTWRFCILGPTDRQPGARGNQGL